MPVDAHAGGNITAEKIAQNKALFRIRQTDTGKIRKLGKSCDQRRFWYLDQLQDSGKQKSSVNLYGTRFLVAAVAFILQLLIAIPIGVISATKQYSIF